MAIMAFLIILELACLFISIHTLSSVRAYVGGEGFWSKGQKNAIYHLQRYGLTHDENDLKYFHEFIKIPLGDNEARVELLKDNPDLKIIRKGFIQGENHPDDIDGMITLIRRFNKISYIAKVITIWTEADPIIAQLIPISEKLHQEIVSANPSAEKINLILAEITPINLRLTKLENDFSTTLGEGARWLEGLILKILFIVALTVALSGLLIMISVSKGITKGISEIIRISNKIAKTDFSEKAKVYSKDEIGILAHSFNTMASELEQNINDRKRTEESLRIKTNQLAEAQEAAHIGSWTWDLKSNKIEWSDELFRIYGFKPQEFDCTYETYLKFIHPDDREELHKVIQQASADQQPFSHFHKLIRPDGSVHILSSKGTVTADANGNTIRMTGTGQNVTDIKLAEEALVKAKISAEESATSLKIKNMQLVDFCNIISHDLRSPLINISMLIDFIERTKDEQEQKKALAKIKPVVTRLTEVFNQLVESIQVKHDTEIKSDKIVLSDCIRQVLKGFESQVQSYEADIQISLEDAPFIYYPQKYIDSIFTNLISNALKYKSPDRKPVITIKTQDVNGAVLLTIADNGLGIDLNLYKDKLFKIRQVFHEHPDAKGFGLFLTKTHIEAMGGRIWAESTPGIGTTFFIEFKTKITWNA